MSAGMAFLILWVVLGAAGFCYLYRRRIRHWWRTDVIERNLPPHQRWPEILHWQKGDEFDTRGWRYYSIHFISFADNQTGAYCRVNYDDIDRLAISSLVGTNISLRNRNMSQQMKDSGEYDELIRQFQIAYKELEERDKKMRLVS